MMSLKIIIDSTAGYSPEELEQLDQAFIARNLSPGGCADLLAITYFLWFCREQQEAFF